MKVFMFIFFKEIIEDILQLVCEAVQNVCYFGNTHNVLNEPCLSIIKVYVKYNTNRFTTNKNSEEENLSDLMLILQLLNNLMAKHFIEDESEYCILYFY